MKFLLLSNVNMHPLLAQFKAIDVDCGAYNSLLADLSTINSPAAAVDVTHVICISDTDTMLGEAFYGSGTIEQCEIFLSALDSFCSRHPDKVVVANTFCVSSYRWLGFADLIHQSSLKSLEDSLNARLVSVAKKYPNLLLFSTELLFRRHGEDALLSYAFWYAGRIRYTARMFELLGDTIHRAIAAHAQKSRKVLVLDLDNTLWGGVIGELGALGVALGEDGPSRCRRSLRNEFNDDSTAQ
jgi:hypothetical protein